MEKLTGLQAILHGPAAHEFVLLYLMDADSHIARIEALADGNDLNGISQEAHILVGTAGNVGAMRVSALARKLEGACRNNDRHAARAGAEQLKAAHAETSGLIQAWLDDAAHSAAASAAR
jgi:HPt (histidine-containing phosphotransfer) domain-containing protein